MPYTARVRSAVAEYLLRHPKPELRRRLAILRAMPFPPGSRSIGADEEWNELSARFPNTRAYIYGTGGDGLVYMFDSDREVAMVELVIVDGIVVP